jgi:hypothetical protein
VCPAALFLYILAIVSLLFLSGGIFRFLRRISCTYKAWNDVKTRSFIYKKSKGIVEMKRDR